MTEEEKDLVLFDICARLPHSTIVNVDNGKYREDVKLESYIVADIDEWQPKLYLRPLSSMTKDEEEDLRQKTGAKLYSYKLFGEISCNISFPSMDEWGDELSYSETDWVKVFDWLNSRHFDYRGLIKKGLALEAPEDMYKLI